MSQQKRSYERAFMSKKLNGVKINDYYVETTVYKVLRKSFQVNMFDVLTTRNEENSYGGRIITDASKSASIFETEEKLTKTELIKLFSIISVNDVWSAVFYKQETSENWQEELVSKIQGMRKDDAVKYMKKEFYTFGRVVREMRGRKISHTSNNNYYLVCDLDIYFDEMERTSNIATAEKSSIRYLDVNTIQSIIFNGVKYKLK